MDEAARVLGAARPTASNLGWALERWPARRSRRAATCSTSPAACERDQLEADRALSELGAERFEPGDRALTHCNTGPLATGGYGTAAGVLRAAWEAGRLGHVWVDETRPLLQGARLTAWELERFGIPYELVADSAAGSLMAQRAGGPGGGGRGPDRRERRRGEQDRHLPARRAGRAARHPLLRGRAGLHASTPPRPTAPPSRSSERDPDGGGARAPGSPRLNPAFDVTPAELVTAIFTEAGVLEPPYPEAIERREPNALV